MSSQNRSRKRHMGYLWIGPGNDPLNMCLGQLNSRLDFQYGKGELDHTKW